MAELLRAERNRLSWGCRFKIRPRAAVPIHWGTYWPHAMGRVFPERLVEPPAAFAEYAAELVPDIRIIPTAVGDKVEWEA